MGWGSALGAIIYVGDGKASWHVGGGKVVGLKNEGNQRQV